MANTTIFLLEHRTSESPNSLSIPEDKRKCYCGTRPYVDAARSEHIYFVPVFHTSDHECDSLMQWQPRYKHNVYW